MCNLSGVPRTTYQRVEHGVSDVKFSHLLRIARVLRIPVRDLIP